jgi:hypothetical protein
MRGKLVALVVPLIMIVGAIAHGWRVHTYAESPWVGAGFGMFADIDGPQRSTELLLVDGESITGPSYSAERLARVSNFPSEEAMRRLVHDSAQIAGMRISRPNLIGGTTLVWEEVASYGDH